MREEGIWVVYDQQKGAIPPNHVDSEVGGADRRDVDSEVAGGGAWAEQPKLPTTGGVRRRT